MCKLRNYFCFLLIASGLVLASCEKEGLTEEEVMNLTREATFTVKVEEQSTDLPVEGAEVTLISSGNTLNSTTDEFGTAYFEGVAQGDAIITLKKDGYFDLVKEIEIFSNGRVNADNIELSMFSEENAVLVKGNVKIQTDLTTEESEMVDGIEIFAYYYDEVIASAKTDVSGNYTLMIPVMENGQYIYLGFPDLSFDQKVAVRTESGVEIKTAKNTIFRPFEEAEPLPNTANIIATIDDPDRNDGWQAYVESVTVESGEITDVKIGEVGYGYFYYRTDSYITINSETGSGANIRIGARRDYDYCWPYYDVLDLDDLNIFNGGIGYPDYEPNMNVFTKHPEGFTWDNCTNVNSSIRLYPSEIYTINVDYGTGTETGEIF